jgi:hypothetical protein
VSSARPLELGRGRTRHPILPRTRGSWTLLWPHKSWEWEGGRETEHPVVAPCAGEVRERDVTRDRRPRRGCGGGRGKEPLPAGVAAGWGGLGEWRGGSTQNIRGAERNGTSAARAMSPSSFFGERKSSSPRVAPGLPARRAPEPGGVHQMSPPAPARRYCSRPRRQQEHPG